MTSSFKRACSPRFTRLRAAVLTTFRFSIAASTFLFAQDVPGQIEEELENQIFIDADIEIVNGEIVVKEGPGDTAAAKDPAGEQVLELTDGSQLHGKLLSLGKNEISWQRADATKSLTFLPQEIRRLKVAKAPLPASTSKANATLKLTGTDWIVGELKEFKDGKFLVGLPGDSSIEIERSKVEWLSLAPAKIERESQAPPDVYDGPVGPLGLAGWDIGPELAVGWDYADGAFVAKTATPIVRDFDVLPEKVDIQFSAGDGGSNRGLALWLQPSANVRGYVKGSCYLRFQGSSVSANIFTGDAMKNPTETIPDDKDDRKLTRYRLLFDRKDGRLIIQLNGKQVADWDLPEASSPSPGGSISWQPSYFNSNSSWTLSNIRVQPWDGSTDFEKKKEAEGKDLLTAGRELSKPGVLESITADQIIFNGTSIPRTDNLLIHLSQKESPEPPPSAIGHVWLASRGEFDISGIGFKDDHLTVRTAFAGDLVLPVAAVRAVEFPHKASSTERNVADGGDMLVFKNGDQLKGTLIGVSSGKPLQWKPVKGDGPVEFAADRIAGVLLANRSVKEEKPSPTSSVVRFRNGDWLPGELLGLDADQLHLKTIMSNNLTISRSAVETIYFGHSGDAPVWDGSTSHDLWAKGILVPGYYGGDFSSRRKEDKKISPWRYLDGAFTLIPSGNRANGTNLGRTFENLPEKVDFSFELSTTKGPASYMIQLFFDENKPGIMIQGGWDSAYIYDMSPRRQNAGFFGQPQQLEFGDSVGSDNNRRHFRFLGDRRTGRVWMFVDGRKVGVVNKRTNATNPDSPKPGKGIAIVPQPTNSRVTISRIWVAPWSGALPSGTSEEDESDTAEQPDQKKAEPQKPKKPATDESTKKPVAQTPPPSPPPSEETPEASKTQTPPNPPDPEPIVDAVALVNGDETTGTVLTATPTELKLKCEVGDVTIPSERTLLVELGAKSPPIAPKPGIRFRFADKGAITVDSFRIEKGEVICATAAAGELRFSLSAISEIIFEPNASRPFEKLPAKADAPEQTLDARIRRLLVPRRVIIP